MNERLERAVANSADFLREAHEDLRFAAILASETHQPRRSGSLSRAASTAKELGGELMGAWVAARKSEPKVTKLVGATLPRNPPLNHGGDVPRPPGTTLVPPGGEQVTITRGWTKPDPCVAVMMGLQMPAATPPEVVDVLFSIAKPLNLDTDTVWPIESLPREIRELASDAGHNDETARATVSIDDVCRALGIDAMIHEAIDGEGVSRPATREEVITKLEGIRAALEHLACLAVEGARVTASKLEAVEEGLVSKFAERLGETDPAWLEALVKESS